MQICSHPFVPLVHSSISTHAQVNLLKELRLEHGVIYIDRFTSIDRKQQTSKQLVNKQVYTLFIDVRT